ESMARSRPAGVNDPGYNNSRDVRSRLEKTFELASPGFSVFVRWLAATTPGGAPFLCSCLTASRRRKPALLGPDRSSRYTIATQAQAATRAKVSDTTTGILI